MDFQFDATTDGRPVKIVSIVDEHTRECLGGLVDRSITADDLIDELDRLAAAARLPGGAALRQRPRTGLRRDGRLGRRTRRPGLHPTRRALAQRLHRIVQRPGPRRMPEHQHVLVPDPSRVVISDWKDEYNHHRRHSALGYQTPRTTLLPAPTDELTLTQSWTSPRARQQGWRTLRRKYVE